jgi:hypothetical protein
MNEALLAAQQLRVAAAGTGREGGRGHPGRPAPIRWHGRPAQEEERQVRERHETLSRQFAAYLANFRRPLERQLGEIEGLQAHAQITHQVQTELLLKRHA